MILPGTEAVSIAKLTKVAESLCESLLGNVLRILAVSQHTESHAKCERGGLPEPNLKLSFEVLRHAD